MSQSYENVKINGCDVPTTSEWTPYNPFTMKLPNEELQIDIPKDKQSWRAWYADHLLGYAGITPRKYLTMDAELLKRELDRFLILKDEFIFMQWIYQLVRHHGDPESQQVFQMPEDFYREFIFKNHESLPAESNFGLSLCKDQLVWVSSSLIISPVHGGVTSNRKVIPIYNLKIIVVYLLNKLRRKKVTITYTNLCQEYSDHCDWLWNRVFQDHQEESIGTPITISDSLPIYGWVEDGQQYKLTSHFTYLDEVIGD